MTVAAPGRRADGDEHRLGVVHRGGEIAGEREAAGGDVLRHQLVEARLVDRHAALRAGRRALSASTSTTVTSVPNSAKHAAETRPT